MLFLFLYKLTGDSLAARKVNLKLVTHNKPHRPPSSSLLEEAFELLDADNNSTFLALATSSSPVL